MWGSLYEIIYSSQALSRKKQGHTLEQTFSFKIFKQGEIRAEFCSTLEVPCSSVWIEHCFGIAMFERKDYFKAQTILGRSYALEIGEFIKIALWNL